MSEAKRPAVGSVAWCDLTVPNAEAIRDFYSRVVGWNAEPLDPSARCFSCPHRAEQATHRKRR